MTFRTDYMSRDQTGSQNVLR